LHFFPFSLAREKDINESNGKEWKAEIAPNKELIRKE
jgi:hypothetical protein